MTGKKIIIDASKVLGQKAALLTRTDGSVRPDRSAIAKIIVKPD